MKQEEDLAHKFWKEYESMDFIDRREKLKHVVAIIDELHTLKDNKLRLHCLATGLQSYFDDLMEYMNSMRRMKITKKTAKSRIGHRKISRKSAASVPPCPEGQGLMERLH